MTVFSGHELDDCPLCRRPLLCPPRYCRSVPGEPWGGRDRLRDLSLRPSGLGPASDMDPDSLASQH